ncbi:MAG: helix-turn-helix domain-containing protein [Acidobacteria bacterium]|nr:helix-turn-helix domain-containing protein [Acidobacteriota bacterium]
MTTALLVEPGQQRFVGVRFRPAGAFPFLAVPMDQLTDRRVDLADVWPGGRSLEMPAADSGSLLALVARLEAGLLSRVNRLPAPDPLVQAVVRALADSGGGASIAALAGAYGVSRQQLRRRFRQHIGINPKRFSRVLRFRRLLQAITSVPRPELALAALEAGYFDQAHMISDFKELTGLSPTQYLAAR